MDNYLLTLCIPTYNRAPFLDECLSRIHEQYRSLTAPERLELIVSDNCSTDATEEVVKRHIDRGLPINYVKNAENLGMDGNFVQCFKMARGKYVWLLGDDDYLMEGRLNDILYGIEGGDYGLVHLQMNARSKNPYVVFKDTERFLAKIRYGITCISANIVSTKFVREIDFEKYMGTFLTLVPLYLTAATSSSENLLFTQRVLDGGHDTKRNGGYNLFQVFVVHFLSIWKEYTATLPGHKRLYRKVKRILFAKFLCGHGHIYRCLIFNNKGNYQTEGGWAILRKYYGKEIYAYGFFLLYLLVYLFRAIKKGF